MATAAIIGESRDFSTKARSVHYDNALLSKEGGPPCRVATALRGTTLQSYTWRTVCSLE